VVGDKKGRVGFGLGKGADTPLALEKAERQAKKNLLSIPITESGSIPFETEAKFGAARVKIRPKRGGGLVAGGALRIILDLAGVRHASAKILSHSKNKINNARASLEALRKIKTKVRNYAAPPNKTNNQEEK
jgi:small subunit ribosomal protein S5